MISGVAGLGDSSDGPRMENRALLSRTILTMTKQPCVYILASKRNGTLYTGVTGNLPSRVWAHKSGAVPGFTKRYGIKQLVWFEFHNTMDRAIIREKQIKEWQRKWKLELIEAFNPNWRDLYDDLLK